MDSFVHLHTHSEYSVNHSLIKIKSLIETAKKLKFSSIALTDNTNVFAAIKFYQNAISNNIKPIFGATITVLKYKQKTQLLLLCQNKTGFNNLSLIISKAYLSPQGIDGVLVNEQDIIKHNEGLILCDTATQGIIAHLLLNNEDNLALPEAKKWQKIFNNRYYLGIQRTHKVNDEKHLQKIITLATTTNIPVVATNAVNFLVKDDFNAHEARVCISDGNLLDDNSRIKKFTPEQYLKSPNEMSELFKDIPEALENSVQIAKRCNVHFQLHQENYLPDFPIESSFKNIADFLENHSHKQLSNFINTQNVDKKTYQNRLDFELNVINKMGFAGYFMIVADFIAYAKQQKIPVGPGRGSGAGSLVAFVLGITNVDPIKHGLLFERFLNPERVSMPDFDIDFCTQGRDEVIKYVADKYGQEKVSQIITYGTMAAKGVVRDVGRVLGHPYGFSDRLAKLIPNELKMTLDKALEESEELKKLYDSDESVKELFDLAKKLEGLVRNVGTHAGGVVIAPSQISDFCPIYKGPDDNDIVVAQFDKDDIEAIGLVKFDFLGLSNLTTIDKTVQTIKQHYGIDIDINDLPLHDEEVFKLLQKTDTTGVFQLESDGMRQYLKKLQADSFEDIVAMLALYRPGPLDAGMVDDYINVKHGGKAKYPHPMLEKILAPTNGVFLYQEQVMQSAQVMAGYSLGSADLLRRAMGKKKPEEMEKQRSVFVEGAKKKGVDETKANEIFNLIDKFSGYGFNKSHSVAYALISYQTAWLKSHYPAVFMASILSSVMGDSDKVAFVIKETKAMNINILAPDINSSFFNFSIKDDNNIHYGLGSIKGVGENVINQLVKKRQNNPYQDLFDFCSQQEKGVLNRRALEALIYSGAFDKLEQNRAFLKANIDIALTNAQQQQQDKLSGQTGLFNTQITQKITIKQIAKAPWDEIEKLNYEQSVLGFYFSNHPTNTYNDFINKIKCQKPSDIGFRNNREVRVLGLISMVRYRNLQKGQMAMLTISDENSEVPVVMFSEPLSQYSENIKNNTIVLIQGKINKDFREQWQIVANSIETIEAIKIKYAKKVIIKLNKNHTSHFNNLATLLQSQKGECPVQLTYTTKGLKGDMFLKQEYKITPNKKTINSINELLTDNCAKIQYD
ncbi:DNA polymerase III alpha subunit [hydrothermal vent metagenome]|uniref:DNA polymerase III subunit alpha n=1 Tax=hydrothermal vent metagenome TaxID=652676 RepID=A0A1W1CV94_9ZZZZ